MKPETNSLSQLEEAVIALLAYYQIFQHPLTAREVATKITYVTNDAQVGQALQVLVSADIIQQHGAYYYLKGQPALVDRRLEGEERAKKLMRTARRMAGLIYIFPFVRGVFISGSLSKGSVPEDADIDFFIITKKHRLWVARTLLVMFKRMFLLNSKKYFCVNYFVDEDTLEIPDHNMFTATEIGTLIPLRGMAYYDKFVKANDWVEAYCPNLKLASGSSDVSEPMKRFSRGVIERLFPRGMAERLDKYFMKKTYQRWMKLYGGNYTDEQFELAFRSHRGTSKNHNKNYQSKVLQAIEENIAAAMENAKTETVDG